MDIDGDNFTDIILISSPMFIDTDREGRVYVCSLSRLVNYKLFLAFYLMNIFCFLLQSKNWPSSMCFHQNVYCNIDFPFVLRGDASANSRFGSSVAVLPDLNQDRLNDLAIGAPLENDGQGSIYIFNSKGQKKISEAYSQVNEIENTAHIYQTYPTLSLLSSSIFILTENSCLRSPVWAEIFRHVDQSGVFWP